MTTFKRYTGTDWEYVNLPTFNSGPAATLGYAQVTANQGSIGNTPTDLIGLVVTVTVPEGRRIRITGQVVWSNTGTTGTDVLYIREGGTQLASDEVQPHTGTATAGINGYVSTVLSPTAGTHTYKLMAQATAGTLTMVANSTAPAYILVEDVTGSTLPYNAASVPVGQLAYAQVTASQTGIVAGTDLTGLSVNVSVPSGRRLRITANTLIQRTVADGTTSILIFQDGVLIETVLTQPNIVNEAAECTGAIIITPTAGAHTYKLQLERTTGTGTTSLYAASNQPAFILVEDITPTPAPGTGAPGSTLGYAQITADQAGITAITPITGLSVNVVVPAGRRLRITSKAELLSTVSADKGSIFIRQDGGIIQGGTTGLDVTPRNYSALASVVVTPTAGAHTYTVDAERTNGTGSMTVSASASFPAFLLVEDITGALWPVGSPVTGSLFASEAWTPYVPSHSGITVGNGTETAAYMKLGRTVHVRWTFILGGTSVIGADPRAGLPFAANVTTGLRHVGSLNLLDTGVRNYCGISLIHESDSTHAFLTHTEAGNAGTVNATNPFTWGSTDAIVMSMTYEAVS